MEQRTIGKFIAVLRKSRGMTQKELAEKLGVSDKTVSHWERDESAPDISLIPVIAEIFSVTCDELLRGEKASEQPNASDGESNNGRLSEKSEKQVKHLFDKALNRLKMKSIICVGITAAGFIVSLIVTYLVGMHLGSSTEYTGLLCAVVFYIVSLALTAVFRFQFGASVKSDDLAPSPHHTQKANLITFLSAGFTAIMFCFTLPVCDRTLSLGDRSIDGSKYTVVCLAVLAVIWAVLKRVGLLGGGPARTDQQKKLFLLRFFTVAVTVGVLLGAFSWENNLMNRPVFIDRYESYYYNDVDDFIDLITDPHPVPDYVDEQEKAETEEKMSQAEYTITVGGEEYRFEWENGEVAYFEVEPIAEDEVQINVDMFVSTESGQMLQAQQKRVFIAGFFFYPGMILLAVGVYIFGKRKISMHE